MLKSLLIATICASTLCASAGMAQNTGPVCPPQTLNYGPFPQGVDLTSYVIDPVQAACTSSTGNLKLSSVSSPARLISGNQAIIDQKLTPGQFVIVTFTVSDPNGKTATSTLKIIRK